MRILMVNLTDWSVMSGGAQHQLGLFEAFRALGHDVRMITSCLGETEAMPSSVREHAILVSSVRTARLPANLDTLAQIPALIAEIVRFRPDVVYSRENALTIAVVAVCRMLGVKIVIEHNSWLENQRLASDGSKRLAGFERLLQIGAARLANGSRCVTQGLADRLRQAGVTSERLVAIGNGCDPEHFFPIPRAEALAQFGLPDDRAYVGFIGNVMPWHGLETAIEGFAANARRFPDVDLVIFGDGEGLAPLLDLAARLGIADRVKAMGRVPYCDANAAINCFDLAILPLTLKRDIGFGFSAIKLRDYAAAGRMVLTGFVPGNIEISKEPWMLTHAADNSEDFAGALALWLESRHGDLGHWADARRQARQYALKNFAWKRIAGDILEFVTRLSARRAAAPAGAKVPAEALRRG